MAPFAHCVVSMPSQSGDVYPLMFDLPKWICCSLVSSFSLAHLSRPGLSSTLNCLSMEYWLDCLRRAVSERQTDAQSSCLIFGVGSAFFSEVLVWYQPFPALASLACKLEDLVDVHARGFLFSSRQRVFFRAGLPGDREAPEACLPFLLADKVFSW